MILAIPLLLAAVLLVPGAAHACAACAGPEEQTRGAFIATTVFLSVLPPGMVGGLVFWLRGRARDAREEARRLESLRRVEPWDEQV